MKDSFVNCLVEKKLAMWVEHSTKEEIIIHCYILPSGKIHFWKNPLLYKICADGMIGKCIPNKKIISILNSCHSSPYEGHFGPTRITSKVLQSGFYWPYLQKTDILLLNHVIGVNAHAIF